MHNKNLSCSLESLVQSAMTVRNSNFPPIIHFDMPKSTKPVSVTGSECSLDCAHCGGHYLKHMPHIHQALDIFQSFQNKSFLVSGGCNLNGGVELSCHLDEIRHIKETGCKINMHTGLISDTEIDEIALVADCVAFDFVIDDETIKEVYGTEKKGLDYIETYIKLKNKVKVIPHVCIGLKGGEIKGEYAALTKLHELGAEGLVFIIFTPTLGTRYADKKPPALNEVIEILARTRQEFPNIPINLGCLRPGGAYRQYIDYYAIECGVNKIVNPASSAIKRAQQLEFNICYGEECCVL